MNISVIIPVYNVERFVERCITSIMKQTYTDGVECIIINDCTPDRSMEIVERLITQYGGPILFKLIYHENNKGIAAVRNTGLDAATGDYTIYIDSDDYCEPDMLEKMYKKALEEDADIVGAAYWIENREQQIYVMNNVASDRNVRLKDLLLNKLGPSIWSKLIRRKLYIDNHLRYVDGLNMGEDLFIIYRLFYYAQRIICITAAFTHYIKYNSNSYTVSMSLNSLKNIAKGDKCMMEFFYSVGLEKELQDELVYRRILNRMMILQYTDGSLQKEMDIPFRNIPYSKSLKALFSNQRLSLYWKIGYSFAFIGALPIYNFMKVIRNYLKCRVSNQIWVPK